MKRLVAIFKEIVSIDSESSHEEKMADYLMQYLQELGYKPQRDAFDNIYCRIGEGENPVLFCAHQDTVSPGNGIEVVEKGGALWSKGDTILGADNKVSLAAILRAVEILHNLATPLNIELLFSVREETSSGISDFNPEVLEAKEGFVFDGGGLGTDLGWCVMEAPYIDDLWVTIHGRSAHASKPENGINALKILTESNVTMDRIDEVTVMNIGKIHGGTAMNTIPGEIVLEGDIRSHSEESFVFAKDDFNQKLEASAQRIGGTVDIQWKTYAFGYQHNQNSDMYQRIEKLYQEHDITLKPLIVPTGSDAGFLNANGVTTYCLGDGVHQAHTLDEHIYLKDFGKLLEVVVDLMEKF